MIEIKISDEIIVYDRYRFAIPLKAVFTGRFGTNGGIEVELKESNNKKYPIGEKIWIHEKQLEIVK